MSQVAAPDDIADPVDTAGHRWRRLPLGARIVIVVVAVVIGLNLVAQFVQASTGGGGAPSGRRSSAYGTQDDGLAAYADLLRRDGHVVERTRGSLAGAVVLDPSATYVILDPDTVSTADADVLLTFVVNGGRLVIGGSRPAYFTALRDTPPQWEASGPKHWGRVDSSLSPIATIASNGDGRFAAAGASTALVSEGSDALVTQASVGRGTVVFVADASPLQNRLLATADNAALGLAIAGEAGRTVVFPEGVHGYGPSRGLAAIPSHWKIALLGLAVAGLVLMWARGRRLGPPEDSSRALPPPRAAYVDAVGATLARTHRPDDALQTVAARVRAHIDATGELDPDEFAQRASALGFSEGEINAVTSPITDDSVLALGRALSHVVSSTERVRS